MTFDERNEIVFLDDDMCHSLSEHVCRPIKETETQRERTWHAHTNDRTTVYSGIATSSPEVIRCTLSLSMRLVSVCWGRAREYRDECDKLEKKSIYSNIAMKIYSNRYYRVQAQCMAQRTPFRLRKSSKSFLLVRNVRGWSNIFPDAIFCAIAATAAAVVPTPPHLSAFQLFNGESGWSHCRTPSILVMCCEYLCHADRNTDWFFILPRKWHRHGASNNKRRGHHLCR